jgi:LysR family transcriptional activator of nhaA
MRDPWLNYHHLLYFWSAARLGSVTRAAAELSLAQQTVSGQIRQLEEALGERLFVRVGRRLQLTEVGRVVHEYADGIFATGRELVDTVRRGGPGRTTSLTLRVGIADVLPKLVVQRLLAPALALDRPVRLVCHEDRTVDVLVAELAAHRLDLVLADAPAGADARGARSHPLGACGTVFLAAPRLAARCRGRGARALAGVPVLLPGQGSSLRRDLDVWFDGRRVRPHVAGEFDDPALMNLFGGQGAGVFPAPSLVEAAVRRQQRVRLVARVPSVRHRFFAITMERRLPHPAAAAVCRAGRS